MNLYDYINQIQTLEEPSESQEKFILEKVTNATVGIVALLKISAHGGKLMTSYLATGVLINKEKGWILTNKHVANSQSILQNLNIKFYDGKKLDGKLIYDDPQHDFAVIKVNKDEIPIYSNELTLSNEKPQLKQQVFMIGFNGGVDFAYQDGKITRIDYITDIFSTQALTISLNTKGGSSGSAVCNEEGKVVALNFAFSDITATAIPSMYISDALSQLELGDFPVRKSLGVTFFSCNLDDAAKFAHFPKDKVSYYMETFPAVRNEGICIDKVIPNTPAVGEFQPYDLLWQVNNQYVKNDLYNLEKLIDQSNSTLSIEVFRDGNHTTIDITPYSLNTFAIKKMLDIDGLILIEADEKVYMKIGAQPRALYANPVDSSSSLKALSNSIIKKLSIIYVNSLDDVIELLPQLKTEKDFVAYTKNMCQCSDIKDPFLSAGAEGQEVIGITVDESLHAILYEFNVTDYSWVYNNIL